MFDDSFSFASARSSYCDARDVVPISPTSSSPTQSVRSVSPCASIQALPRSTFSIADLATQFSHSRLRTESSICYDSCEAYANLDDDAGWLIADSPTSDYKPTSRPTMPSRPTSHRSARQSSARLLCSSSHRHDIAALVARMVHTEDQCSVAHNEFHPSELTLAADDEGYDSSEMDGSSASCSRRTSVALQFRGLEYRRSSDIRCGSICVSKTARFRKDRNHTRRPTAEK